MIKQQQNTKTLYLFRYKNNSKLRAITIEHVYRGTRHDPPMTKNGSCCCKIIHKYYWPKGDIVLSPKTIKEKNDDSCNGWERERIRGSSGGGSHNRIKKNAIKLIFFLS